MAGYLRRNYEGDCPNDLFEYPSPLSRIVTNPDGSLQLLRHGLPTGHKTPYEFAEIFQLDVGGYICHDNRRGPRFEPVVRFPGP